MEYQYIKRWDVGLIIPINETNKGNYTYSKPFEITEHGVPKCQAELEMTNWGFCRDRCRIKWRCPVKASKEHQNFDCPFADSCSDSDYGRVIYTKPQWDYRIHTPVPRESKLWKSLENGRSASERSNKVVCSATQGKSGYNHNLPLNKTADNKVVCSATQGKSGYNHNLPLNKTADNKRKKYDFSLLNTRTSGRKFWFFRVMLASMCQHIDEWYRQQSKEEA